jgi:thiol-disulfide isomerase/thioredoxin
MGEVIVRFRCLTDVLAIALLFASPPVFATESTKHRFVVEDWLRRPGVTALAVEFFATWCKPCMESVPKWRALREKYGPLGFRLVVVSTRDPEGVCSNPGWSPDEIVCDDDGRIASRFGVDTLPAVDLFTWQGRHVVHRGRVEDVEEKLSEIARAATRVDIEIGTLPRDASITPGSLGALVRARLASEGKLTIIADATERRKLAALKKRSFDSRYDDALECIVGRELSANALLRVFITPVPERRLILNLLSVERGCLEASASAAWTPKNPALAIAEAVSELLDRMRSPPVLQTIETTTELASLEPSPPRSRSLSERDPIVSFRSSPNDAIVLVDGKLVCHTDCSRAVAAGTHRITMQKEKHRPKTEDVEVKDELQLAWELAPSYGKLDVTSTPEGAVVTINGEEMGRTPPSGLTLDPGTYQVQVADPCHQPFAERVLIVQAEHTSVSPKLVPRSGAIEVSADDAIGNEIAADVYARGEKVGRTPSRILIPACAQMIEVRDDKGRVWSEQINVEERATTRVRAKLVEVTPLVASDDDTLEEKDREITALHMLIAGLTSPALHCAARPSEDYEKHTQDLQHMFTLMSARSDARPQLLRQIADCSLKSADDARTRLVAAKTKHDAAYNAKMNAIALISTKRAIEHLEILFNEYPNLEQRDELLATLGQASARAGDFERAQTHFKELFRFYPDSFHIAAARLTLAQVYDALTKRDRSYSDRAYNEYSRVPEARSPGASGPWKTIGLYARLLRAKLIERMGHDAAALTELKQIATHCHDHPLDAGSTGLLHLVERELKNLPHPPVRAPIVAR